MMTQCPYCGNIEEVSYFFKALSLRNNNGAVRIEGGLYQIFCNHNCKDKYNTYKNPTIMTCKKEVTI